MANRNLKARQDSTFSSQLKARVMAVHNAITNDPIYKGLDAAVLGASTKLLSVEVGRTEWEMEIAPCHSNTTGDLHGGVACLILDNLTSTALLTLPDIDFAATGHVSRTLTTTYLRPVPTGAKIKIISEVVTVGRSTANIRGEIQVLGKTCVTCIHDKVLVRKADVFPKQRQGSKL